MTAEITTRPPFRNAVWVCEVQNCEHFPHPLTLPPSRLFRLGLLDDPRQIGAVGGLDWSAAAWRSAVEPDEAVGEGDLLGAGDLEALPVLQHLDELAASRSASWVPVSSQAIAAAQQLDVQLRRASDRRG